MNKSIKKCCICSNSETGEFIMIGDNKYHLSCIEKMQKEKQEIKEQLEDMTLCRDIASGHRKEVQDRETILLNQQKEFIEWLESEKDRLAKECSHIYEDSLGRTRLVSEDIYNEVSKILSKIEKSDK